MASQSLRIKLQKPFHDAQNYPYGFSRSGDFSIRESQLLQEKGGRLKALWEGVLMPETEEEKGFLAMLKGEKQPESTEEKLWLKYLKRINRPHISTLNSKPELQEAKPDEESSSNDDLELDDQPFSADGLD